MRGRCCCTGIRSHKFRQLGHRPLQLLLCQVQCGLPARGPAMLVQSRAGQPPGCIPACPLARTTCAFSSAASDWPELLQHRWSFPLNLNRLATGGANFGRLFISICACSCLAYHACGAQHTMHTAHARAQHAMHVAVRVDMLSAWRHLMM